MFPNGRSQRGVFPNGRSQRGLVGCKMLNRQCSISPEQQVKPECIHVFKNGLQDLKFLLNYLFTQNAFDRIEAKMHLLDVLGSKEAVNTSNIGYLTLKFLTWYEFTTEELIATCVQYGIFKPSHFCFCGYSPNGTTKAYRDDYEGMQALKFYFHDSCEFVTWLAESYKLPLTGDTVIDINYIKH
ncbi:unnamed protein product [Meganyctiphanes norvegica]|uniref:Uncharacterized protein n=1 Tax=Meganyctiphanes norvegica TaxID=48144 RepID=A0AAV2PN24_MEGNR